MSDFYTTLVFGIWNLALPYLITRRDRRLLSSEQLARAWNGASWACAIFFFGPLCLPAHFWVTRRKATALFVGMAWTMAVVSGELGLAWVIEQVAPG